MADEEAHSENTTTDGEGDQTAPKRSTRDRWVEKWQTLVVAAITAAVGIAGVVGTIVASSLQVDAVSQNQQAQFMEERAKEDREKKADVYFAFLDAADKYAVATENSRTCLILVREDVAQSKPKDSLSSFCVKQIGSLAPKRHDFQGARNKVFAYGSDEAERRAQEIAAYLPDAVGGDPVTGLPPIDDTIVNYDGAYFNELYRNFDRVICLEIPAQPRKSCD